MDSMFVFMTEFVRSASPTRPGARIFGRTGNILGILVWLLLAGLASAEEVPRVGAEVDPVLGERLLQLEELWRTNDDQEDYLLGAVVQVLGDEAGNIYLLDAQLCQVHRFGPTGEYGGSLSREGEGPGENRSPVDLIRLAGGKLGIVQALPGKIKLMDESGDPAGCYEPGEDATAGGYWLLREAMCRGNSLVVCGEQDARPQRIQFLSLWQPGGGEVRRLHEQPRNNIFQTRRYVEQTENFVDRGRWTVGPDGRIYTAPQRDRYAIHVHSATGELERIIERPYEARLRTAEEKQRLADRIVMHVDGQPVKIDTEIEDTAPCLSHLHVDDRNRLWVRDSHGASDLPDGVLLVYDLFEKHGQYQERLSIACEGDARNDRLFLLGNGRFVLVTEYYSALEALRGRSNKTEASALEAEPLQVIVYQARL